jgi:hypothetical protein
LKKLIRTHGIGGSGVNEDEDDLFRPIHAEKRKGLSKILLSRPEVMNSVRVIFDQELKSLPLEKQAGFFTFLVKGGLPITEQDLAKISSAFRHSAANTQSNTKELLSSTAIVAKVASKMLMLDLQQTFDDSSVRRREIIVNLFKHSILPIVESNIRNLNITEASMLLRSIQSVTGFQNAAFPNRILRHQIKVNLEKASNMDLYGILDIALDVNLNVSSQGTGLLDEEPCEIIKIMSKDSLFRLP